jgi:hypothetical protein
MVTGLIWRAFVAILLFLVGKLLSASPEAQERLAKVLAKIGLAKADTGEDIRKAGDFAVKAFYVLSVVFVILLGLFAYHHLRTMKVKSWGDLTPYGTPSTQQTPYSHPTPQGGTGQGQMNQGGATPAPSAP